MLGRLSFSVLLLDGAGQGGSGHVSKGLLGMGLGIPTSVGAVGIYLYKYNKKMLTNIYLFDLSWLQANSVSSHSLEC